MQKLLTGAAYHGNRMLHHMEADLRDMADHHMNLVVHMLSHTDWDRHCRVMREAVGLSQEAGLEVWMDNWGLGGPPGDKSHFLSYHPEAHQIYSNGTPDPVRACLRQPSFRQFVHEWIDTVAYTGAKTIFWDEPHLPVKNGAYSCACPLCRKAFEERYGRPMPETMDKDAEEFRIGTIADYFRDICSYAASKGLENAVCVMLGEDIGINLSTLDRIGDIPDLHNIGSDPYWGYTGVNPYEFVYRGAKKTIEAAERFGKAHNVWIQTYATPRGREEEIVQATEAAYDAGARTIIAWGYFGSISNDYGAENPYLVRAKTNQAFERIWGFERDRILAENRARVRG
ncbi:MAG: hypothetical protein II557_05460 [Clostridia bacterium]|nr:hypothetical protein [Clostridia bacterium]MBR4185959.1 hypothetical protein [Clostridia bacterium]